MINISDELKKEIQEYCHVNNITNIDDFILKMLKQGFTIEKFGSTPMTKIQEKIIEKIVEVPIEKSVYITDNTEILALTEKINLLETNLKEELIKNNTLTQEITSLKQNKKNIYGEL